MKIHSQFFKFLVAGLILIGSPHAVQAIDGPEIVVLNPSGTEAVSGAGTVNFGTVRVDSSASLTYTIKNTGTADLTDLTVSKSGTYASNYVVTQSPVAPLAPGASTTLTVQFIPTVNGVSHPATLSITSNDVDENPFNLHLRGTSARPILVVTAGNSYALDYDFGTADFGESKSMTFVVKNEGGGNMTGIRSLLANPPSSGFAITQSLALTEVLAPGQSAPVTVQFTPVRGGSHFNILRITSGMDYFEISLRGNAQSPEITVGNSDLSNYQDEGSYDFGQVHGKSGAKTFIIRNTGVENLTGLAATLDGPHAADFELSWNPPYTTSLAPNTRAELTVKFTTSTPGLRTAALHITSNDADENPFDINLSGSGSAAIQVQKSNPPKATWSTLSHGGQVHLPSQRPGDEQSVTLKISNTGIEDLTGIAATLNGEHPEVYQITQGLPVSALAPGESATLTLRTRPMTTGTFQADLHITSSDPHFSTFDMVLTTAATLPDVKVWAGNVEIPQGDVLDFGAPDASNTSPTRDVTICNVGIGMMSLRGLVISGPNASDFNIVDSRPLLLDEGRCYSSLLRFRPQGPGTRTATLTIITDAPGEEEYQVILQGNSLLPGLQVEEPVLQPMTSGGERTFMSPTAGTVGRRERTFTIRNTGVNTLTLGNMTISGKEQHFTVTSPPAAQVPPSGTTEFTVEFAPKAAGSLSAELTINSNSGVGPFKILLKGQSIATRVGFEGSLFTAIQGDREARVIIKRSPPAEGAVSVRLSTDTLDAMDLPPFSRAESTLDYHSLSAQLVTFADGEMEKTVSVMLIPNASRGRVNRHFSVKLTDAYPAGITVVDEAGSRSAIQLLTRDSTKPTLTLLTPAAGRMPAPQTVAVTGKVGDALGIREVTVTLNDEAPRAATLRPADEQDRDPKEMLFTLTVTPALGPNKLVVTATDFKGNSTTVIRAFTAVRRQVLTFRTVEAGQTSAASLGTITPKFTTADSASAATESNGVKIMSVDAGAIVELKITPKAGYMLRSWSVLGTHDVALTYLGDTVRFKMRDRTTEVLAQVVPNPFTPPAGRTNDWHWLLHSDDAETRPDVRTEGYLTGTLTTAGGFSGRLLMNGRSLPVVASLHGTGQALFTVAGKKQEILPLPEAELSMQFLPDTGGIQVTITYPNGTSSAIGRRAQYSSTNKVPAALLNSATKGTYTLRLNPVAPQPDPDPVDTATYPQGFGYATITLSNTGAVTLAGLLADGSPIAQSTVLLPGDEAALFVQLLTPAATTKLGLLTGLLDFDTAPATTDVTADLAWFRPAAASTKILLYKAGWPGGISLDAVGALYSATKTAQMSLLGQTSNTPTPAQLTFTGGNLSSTITKTSFSLKDNTVVKLTPVDNSYTLKIVPATGLFSGTFTPNWSNPSSAKPTFKGVILQKGPASAQGFFINNAKGETAPESGSVTLGPPAQ